MLKFLEFVAEGCHVPVVSIDRVEVDIEKEATRNEINKNLAAVTSQDFVNPYAGWVKVAKILSTYHITLPRITFKDADEGEEILAVHQFGYKWGADGHGPVGSPNDPEPAKYYLYFSYTSGEEGFYEIAATITDAEGLENLPSDDADKLPPEGQVIPPQH